MKIGIVIDKLYPGKIGGAEQYVRNIISVMGNKEGIELTLFLNETALGLFENENPERIRCVCVPYQIPRASCLYEYYIAKYGLQVLFCPLFYIPVINLFSVYDKRYRRLADVEQIAEEDLGYSFFLI